MARRRINKRFVTILLVVVIGTGGILFAAQRFLIKEHASKYLEAGKQAMADHKWVDAAQDLSHAGNLNPKDAQIQVMLGEALHNLAMADSGSLKYMTDERSAYDRALEIDPNNLEALKGLVRWSQRNVLVRPSAGAYRELIDFARRAHALAPDDMELAAAAPKAIVQEAASNFETAQKDIDDAIAELRGLMEKNPADADIPLTIARMKMQQAVDLARQSASREQPVEVTKLLAEARELFQVQFTGANGGPQANNAEMHYNYARVLEYQADIDHSDPANHTKFLNEATRQMDAATAEVRDKDPKFLEIKFYAVQMAQRKGDTAHAEDLLRSMPETPDVILMLARILGDSDKTRPEAIKRLQTTLESHGAGTDDWDDLRFKFTAELMNLYIRDYAAAKDPKEKARLLTEIVPTIDKMREKRGGTPDILEVNRLEAQLDLMQGKPIAAIELLGPLVSGDSRATHDLNILMMLVTAYDATSQSGKAITFATTAVENFPGSIPARKELIQLLLREAPAQAIPHIDLLEKRTPDDPDIVRYRISVLAMDPDKNKDQLKAYFDRLPETTPPEISQKARIALALHDWDTAIRLLSQLVEKNPKDIDSVISLTKAYALSKQTSKALEVANKGLQDNPDSATLKVLIPSLKGEDPEAIRKIRRDLIDQEPNAIQRELDYAMLDRESGDVGSVEKHLKAAEKLSPGDPRIWDQLFQLYVATNRADTAGAYVDRLSKANYDSADGAMYRFQLARARNDNAAALEIARKLSQDKPEFAVTWISLGQALQADKQFEQAIVQYSVALGKQSDNIDAIRGIAECNLALNKPNESLFYINMGLHRYPDNVVFREMLINHQLNFGNPLDAVASIQKELDRSPDNPQLMSALAGTYLRVAKLSESQQHHDDATRQLTQAFAILKHGMEKFPDNGDFYVLMAEACVTAGKPADAEAVLTQWAGRDAWKDRPEPQLKLADYYESFRQPDRAESALRSALARSNYRVDLQVRMANLLALHGKFDDALALLRATNADDPTIKRQGIEILLAANRVEEAMAALKTDLDKDPNNTDLLTVAARVSLEHHQFDAALDRANKALAIDPRIQSALYYRALAKAYKTPADPQGAMDDLISLRQTSPYSPEVRIALAELYREQDRPDDAIDELEAGLKNNPRDKSIRMTLVKLYMNGRTLRFTEAIHLLEEVDTAAPYATDPDVFQAEALLYAAHNELPKALEKMRKARELAPQNPALLNSYLTMLLQGKAYQDVLDQTNPLLDQFKGAWWFMELRAQAKKGLNDTAGAKADLLQALNLAQAANDMSATMHIAQTAAVLLSVDDAIAAVTPYAKDKLAAKLALAILQHRKGDDAAATRTLDGILADPSHLSEAEQLAVYTTAARVYAGTAPQPMVDKAYAAYQKAIQLKPDDMANLNDFACLLVDAFTPPRAADALPYAQKAVTAMYKTGRDEPAVLDTLGWVQILAGSAADGVQALKKVIEIKPFPEAYLHLGEGYLQIQVPEEALNQGNLGLALLDKQISGQEDNLVLRGKLRSLIARSQDAIKSKQSAQTP